MTVTFSNRETEHSSSGFNNICRFYSGFIATQTRLIPDADIYYQRENEPTDKVWLGGRDPVFSVVAERTEHFTHRESSWQILNFFYWDSPACISVTEPEADNAD